MAAPPVYRERPPAAALRPHVACLWTGRLGDDGTPYAERVLPDGCVDLVWDGSRLFVAGPDTGPPQHAQGGAPLATAGPPADLLALLLEIERRFGRIRTQRWAPRVLDLDLLAYHDRANWPPAASAEPPVLPHPRLHERAFVLVPLAEIAPKWRHPVLGRTAAELLPAVPPGQFVAVLDPAEGEIAQGPVAGSGTLR